MNAFYMIKSLLQNRTWDKTIATMWFANCLHASVLCSFGNPALLRQYFKRLCVALTDQEVESHSERQCLLSSHLLTTM